VRAMIHGVFKAIDQRPHWLRYRTLQCLVNTTVAFCDEVGDAWRAVSNGISWQ
jgi:hypothetical protein